MFSVSLPKNLSFSFPLRIMFLVLGTCTGAVLYHFRDPTLPTFPPVPEEEAMPSSLPVKNTLKKNRPPRRDPFRPLDHPPSLQPVLPKAAPSPVPTDLAQPPTSASSSTPFRLLGILSVNGNRKALVATPTGTCLLAPGEELPGKGIITELQEGALCCGSLLLSVGEVWP